MDEVNNNEESLISDVTLNSSFFINNEGNVVAATQTSQTLPAPVPCERRHLIHKVVEATLPSIMKLKYHHSLRA